MLVRYRTVPCSVVDAEYLFFSDPFPTFQLVSNPDPDPVADPT